MNKVFLLALVACSMDLFLQAVVSKTFDPEKAKDFEAEKEVPAKAVTGEGWDLDYLNDDYNFDFDDDDDEEEEEEEEDNFPGRFVQEDPKPFWGRKERVGFTRQGLRRTRTI